MDVIIDPSGMVSVEIDGKQYNLDTAKNLYQRWWNIKNKPFKPLSLCRYCLVHRTPTWAIARNRKIPRGIKNLCVAKGGCTNIFNDVNECKFFEPNDIYKQRIERNNKG